MTTNLRTLMISLALTAGCLGGPAVGDDTEPLGSEASAIQYCPPGEYCPPIRPPVPSPLRPNLIAVQTRPNYCNRSGNLVTVRVSNAGTAPAGASVTTLTLGTIVRSAPTPALGVNQYVDLTFTTGGMSECDPACDGWCFTIGIDVNNQVVESNEANSYFGWCLS